MAKSAWYPKATRQDRSGAYPGSSQSQVGIIVLHTTESTGKAGYSGGATAPHLEYHPGTRTWRQFFPFTETSRALANQSGGVQTNREDNGVVQVELCGTSGWSKVAKPSWPSVTDPLILGDIAHFLAWMHAEWGTPLSTPRDPWPAWNSYKASNRLSNSAWSSLRGIVGHSMVPENDHTDPGAFPIGKVLNIAHGGLAVGGLLEDNGMDIDANVTWVRSDGKTHTGPLGLYYWDIGNRLHGLEKALSWLGGKLLSGSPNGVLDSSVRNNLIAQTVSGQRVELGQEKIELALEKILAKLEEADK